MDNTFFPKIMIITHRFLKNPIGEIKPALSLFMPCTVMLTLLLISPLLSAAIPFEEDYVWQQVFDKRLENANSGDPTAQYDIASMYEKGSGVQQNMEKAFRWYTKSAKQANDKAAFKVGYCFLHGKGISKNYSEAFKWLKISADKGNIRAFYTLGHIYEQGLGVNRNLEQSLAWYNKAKTGGYLVADTRIVAVEKELHQEDESTLIIDEAEPSPIEEIVAVVPAQLLPEETATESVTSRLLNGYWSSSDKPALILPSRLTTCIMNDGNIECISSDIERNIGMADIRYTTKSILHDIEDSGEFVISYRNNIVGISITDEKLLKSGDKLPIKLGWQEQEHELKCALKTKQELNCQKSALRQLTYFRQNN